MDTVGVPNGALGRLTIAGTPTFFPITAAGDNPNNLNVSSVGIVSGPDGNLWFDSVAADGRAYISSSTTAGIVTNYLFSMTYPQVGRVAVGPDGNIWAAVVDATTESGSNTIEVCTTSGEISDKVLPTESNPYGVVTGPDKNLWLTETASTDIGRLTTSGTLQEFPPTSFAQNIAVGADGNLWFTEPAGKIGRCTVNGSLVEFAVPTASEGPWDLTLGADGNIWFTERPGKIASVTRAGTITEYAAPSDAYGITTGPDGNIWFTEPSAGKVVRFLVP